MGNTLNCNEVICNENIYEIEWINDKNWFIEFVNKINTNNTNTNTNTNTNNNNTNTNTNNTNTNNNNTNNNTNTNNNNTNTNNNNTNINDKINNYSIINVNFKIFNNGLSFFKLIKKIENIDTIEKIYINFLINYKLLNNNHFQIHLYLINNLNDINVLNNLNDINVLNNLNDINDINDINDLNDINTKINHFTLNLNELIINNKNYEIKDEFKYELSINFTYLNYIIFQEYIKNNENTIHNQIINKNYDKKYKNMFFVIIIQTSVFES